jgi:hypothetical protein
MEVTGRKTTMNDRTTKLGWTLFGALIGGAGGAALTGVVALIAITWVTRPRPATPTALPPAVPTVGLLNRPLPTPTDMRDEAYGHCRDHSWDNCLHMLDQAKQAERGWEPPEAASARGVAEQQLKLEALHLDKLRLDSMQ